MNFSFMPLVPYSRDIIIINGLALIEKCIEGNEFFKNSIGTDEFISSIIIPSGCVYILNF